MRVKGRLRDRRCILKNAKLKAKLLAFRSHLGHVQSPGRLLFQKEKRGVFLCLAGEPEKNSWGGRPEKPGRGRNSLHGETDPQTDAVGTADRHKPVTDGRAAIHSIVDPRTATQHTEFTFFCSLWIN